MAQQRVPSQDVAARRRLRRRLRAAAEDRRGIALQTVIIMVVLVVIAGAVATILVSRAGTETERLEKVNTTVDASKYGNATLCDMAGHTWSNNNTPSDDSDDKCVTTTTTTTTQAPPNYAQANNANDCADLNPAGVWDPVADTCSAPSN